MKNLIITLTLLLGAMSYGQFERAYVAEYLNIFGHKVFSHRVSADRNTNICNVNVVRHYSVRVQNVPHLGGDLIIVDPATHIRNDDIIYRPVSSADVTAFRNDITEGRDPATGHANPNLLERYYRENGGLALHGPLGCRDGSTYSVTPDDYFRSQPDFTGFFGDQFYQFGGVAGVFIRIRHGEFVVDFPTTGYEEVFNTPNGAYARIQELIVLQSWERELVRLGFTPSTHHTYEWERDCPGSHAGIKVYREGSGLTLVENGVTIPAGSRTIEQSMVLIRQADCY